MQPFTFIFGLERFSAEKSCRDCGTYQYLVIQREKQTKAATKAVVRFIMRSITPICTKSFTIILRLDYKGNISCNIEECCFSKWNVKAWVLV